MVDFSYQKEGAENRMKKSVIIITMLITMVLASNASNKTTAAASMELSQPEALALEKEKNQQEVLAPEEENGGKENLVLEKEANQVLLVMDSYGSEWDELLQKEALEIQEIYAGIQANMGSCSQIGGKYYTETGNLVKAELSTGSALDKLMNKYGYSVYQVDYYYEPSIMYDSNEGPVYVEMTVNGNQRQGFYYCDHGYGLMVDGRCREIDTYNPELYTLAWGLEDEGTLILRAYGSRYFTQSPSNSAMSPTDLTDDYSRFVGGYAISEDAERQMMNPEWGGVFYITKIEDGKIYGNFSRYSSAVGANGINLDFSQGVPFVNNHFTAEGSYTIANFGEDAGFTVDEYPCKVDCWFEVVNGKIIIRTWDLNEVGIGSDNLYYKANLEWY